MTDSRIADLHRPAALRRIAEREEPWDLAVVGGGATGAGIAVDAAARGYSVVLLEQSDFGKGTSSRSTKLVHGGVRYLQQGNIPLVMEALRERGLLAQNAPHLVHDLPFVVPTAAKCRPRPIESAGRLPLAHSPATVRGRGRRRHLSARTTPV